MSDNASVLVTGASGFIGRFLCQRLLSDGFSVSGTSRDGTRVPAGTKPVAIRVDGNTDWSAALSGVTTVIHLASAVHLGEADQTKSETSIFRINTEGTKRLASQAAQQGIEKFIFISTVKVNGESTGSGVFRASDLPRPYGPYAESKWQAEQQLHDVANKTGLPITIIRPPLVYGPTVGANMLRLISLVHTGLPLPFGSIVNRRSMINVQNLCDLIVRCQKRTEAVGHTFMASDGQDVSTPELVNMLARATDKRAILFPFPVSVLRLAGRIIGRGAEMDRICQSLRVDMTATQETLDWTPPTSLESGILEMVQSFQMDK
jgi:nucleoside-diphosphate-sugar epimerase